MIWILVFFLSVSALGAPLTELDLPSELEELIPDTLEPLNIKKIMQNPTPQKVVQQIWRYLWQEGYLHTKLMGQIIIIAVLAAIFKEIAASFSKEAGEAGFLAAYLVLVLLLVSSLKETVKLTQATNTLLSNIVKILVPLVAATVAAGGELITTITISPLIIGLSATVSVLLEKIILPLALASGVLGLASYVTKKPRLTRLSGFFRWFSLFLLGLINTVFFGLITSLGIGSAAQDSLTYRTAKFIVGTVPLIGGQVASSTDLLQASTKAVQSLTTSAGLLFLLFTTLFPIIRLSALVLVYKLLQALIEPVVETRFLGALETMEKSVTLFLSLIVLTAIMFYISIGVLAALGSLLLR